MVAGKVYNYTIETAVAISGSLDVGLEDIVDLDINKVKARRQSKQW